MLRDKKKYTPGAILESLIHITRDSERDVLVRSLIGTLHDLLGAERIALLWLRSGADVPEMSLVAETGKDGSVIEDSDATPIPLAQDADFAACVETREFLVRHVEGERFRHVYPIWGRDDVVGVLEVTGPPHDANDIRLTSGFLQIFRNYIQILDASEHDTLTGLLNRRTFDRNIERMLSESRRTNVDEGEGSGPFPQRREESRAETRWLAVMDVDHFKRVNDRFGHLYGDEVLLLLAGIMRRTFRDTDNLFRFGGEEFVVALEPTDEEGARAVLERFRQAVESYEFPQVGKVTISIGFVRIGQQDAPATVVGHADEALYYAKQHGRNQVCCYESLVKERKIAIQQMNEEAYLFE